MTTGVPSATALIEISAMIAARTGLSFPEARHVDLVRGLAAAGADFGFENLDVFVRWLTTKELTAPQIETLASHLTVGETYFFRDPASFEALERDILPSIAAGRADAARTIRLWSAACCTGEEAYSMAISCTRALPNASARTVSVLGTDINPKFLAKAEAGIYSDWSFRGEPDWLRRQFFTPAPSHRLSVNPAIRRFVQFTLLNLAADTYPALANQTNAMDVIFCRNVLMYLTADQQRHVVASLHRCLVDGGYLLVNPAEAGAALFSEFSIEHINGVIVFRKLPPGSRPDPGAPRQAPWPEFAPPVAEDPVDVAPEPAALPTPRPELVAVANATPIPDPPLTFARACANDGRLNEALMLCLNAIAADRTDHVAHFLHATICQELGMHKEAVAALEKVLYLEPDFILAHHGLAGLHRRLGKPRESLRHRSIALTLLLAKDRDEIVPESDGMTCGRLIEAVRAMAGV